MKKLLMLCILILDLIVLTSKARSLDYNWNDYEKPYKITVNVDLFNGSNVYVDLPADYLEKNSFVKLHVDVKSNFTYKIDGLEQKGFEGFSPKISVNGGIIRGNYHIPVKAKPVRQTVIVKIHTKYLKAGKNRLNFYIGKEDAIRYRCKAGKTCTGFFVHELSFDDFKSIKKSTGSQSNINNELSEPPADQEKDNFVGSFENDSTNMGKWNFGNLSTQRTGEGGFQKVYIDKRQGANDTHRCLAMHFRLGEMKKNVPKRQRLPIATIRNEAKRDLSSYSGIEFYIWATKNLIITFGLADVEDGGMSKEERWNRNVLVTTEATKVRISFNSLFIAKRRALKQGTNQILDLNRIGAIHWVAHGRDVPLDAEATIYLDEIYFY